MAKANQPVAKFRVGYVTATVWKNEGNGDKSFYNTVVSKSYRDGEEYKDTDQLSHGDVVCAIRALDRAEEWIAAQK